MSGGSVELDQRLRALALANEIRTRRAGLKRDIRAGDTSFAKVLVDPPDWLLTATVYEMLRQVRRVGPYAAATALSRADIKATATFRTILPAQRTRLLEELFRSPGARYL